MTEAKVPIVVCAHFVGDLDQVQAMYGSREQMEHWLAHIFDTASGRWIRQEKKNKVQFVKVEKGEKRKHVADTEKEQNDKKHTGDTVPTFVVTLTFATADDASDYNLRGWRCVPWKLHMLDKDKPNVTFSGSHDLEEIDADYAPRASAYQLAMAWMDQNDPASNDDEEAKVDE
jgi:hypothetical protein